MIITWSTKNHFKSYDKLFIKPLTALERLSLLRGDFTSLNNVDWSKRRGGRCHEGAI